MSTIAVIAIVVGALIVLAVLVRASQQRKLGRVQAEAKQDDVQHHRERADESRTEAAIAEERAKRARVEAQLDEERARGREEELSDRR
jgi:FtsZ-interacting cell division protein ZipA